MIRFQKTAKISKKGQITLPKAVRELLDTDVVRVVVEGGQIRIEPVTSVAGGLRRYAKGYLPTAQARERAWEQVADEERQRR